jgi:tRNA A-37 threonylcarbamoyl transferase component Bud32
MAESILIEGAGVRWQVQRGLEGLFGPAGLRLEEWLAAGQAQVVKHGPHRTVYHVVLPGLDLHIKQNRVADTRAWLRELVRPSKARSEYNRALAVSGRGVLTIEPLAIGETVHDSATQCSFLITRTLADAQPLNTFLDTLADWPDWRRTRMRQRLAGALGALLAQMHDAGITHDDLHPGNLLLRLEADDQPRLILIDLHAVRLGRPLSWRARQANLILLNRWFMLRSQRTDRLRFWRAYCAKSERRHSISEYRSGARTLEKGTLASNLRFWRGRDGRCLGRNRYFHRLRCGCVWGHAVADLPNEVLAPLLADPEAVFARADVLVLKRSRSSAVVEFDLPGPNGPRRVVYKRFAVTTWTDPWTSLVRPTPALRSFMLGHSLLIRCLPTPRPLAVWHRTHCGLAREGYLLTEKVPDAVDLLRFVAHLHGSDVGLTCAERRACLRSLIDQVARLVASLHQRHLSHRDLKASNVLVSGVATLPDGDRLRVWFIDLVGVRSCFKLRRARRVQNLARLHASFLAHPHVTRTDKLRFLRVYLRWGLRGRAGWKRWWRQVEAATANKVRRNLRNGRPLG